MNNSLSILAVMEPSSQGAGSGQLILGIVIGAIAVSILWWISVSMARQSEESVEPIENRVPAQPMASEAPATVPQELVAVITAAAHYAMGNTSHRILSVRPAETSWSQEGRRHIFASHSVR